MRKKVRLLALAGALIAGFAALWDLTFGVYTVNHIHALIFFKKSSPLFWIVPPLAAAGVLFFGRRKLLLLEYALRPLWLMGGVFFWPTYGTGVFCLALASLTWCALRYGALMHRKFRKLPEPDEKLALSALFLLTAAMGVWCFYLQTAAFKSWYLIYGDWGQYADCYLRLASGNGSLKEWLCSAGHFNPLINLLMTGAFLISPSANTVFGINALVIVSAIPLSFILAKSSGLKNGAALVCAFCAGIFPIYTRQTLSLFYGFHPIIFFIPALLCFFIARSRKNLPAMSGALILSLFIQETVAIFWIGWGVYLFLAKKRYWQGALFSLALAGWFAFLALYLQPWAADAAVYAQNFRYAALGNTPVEVALSPFTRPAVFWSALFSPRNFLFAFIILSPLLWAAISFPALLWIGTPILGGFFVQSSDDVKTPLLQYGVELGTLCWAVAIVNLGRICRGEEPWWKERGKLYRGFLSATAVGVILGYIFFGFGFKFGLFPGDHYLYAPDATKAIAFLKKNLPTDLPRLLVTGRLRGHFMFDYPTASLSTPWKPGDWLLLDLHDPFEPPAFIEPLRHKLYRDPLCRPVTHVSWYGKQLVLLRIAKKADAPHHVKPVRVAAERFNNSAGVPIPTRMKSIHGRYDGRMFHFRLNEQVRADYDLLIRLTFPDGSIKKLEYSWFFGLFPAWAQKNGTLWSVPVKSGFVKCELLFKERPESSLSATQAGQGSATQQGRGNQK